MTAPDAFLQALRADRGALEADFNALCDRGGRLQGTPSADAAFAFIHDAMIGVGAGHLSSPRTAYHGWTLEQVAISLPGVTAKIPCASLVGSVPTPPEGVELEVVDLGRGTPEEIAAAADRVRGRAVLLRHEYAFATETIHRRVKLRAAAEAGAAAVVMVQPFEGYGPVSGGANLCPVPGFGVGIEGARRMLEEGRARFFLQARHHPAETVNHVLDIPGAGPGRIVLSAHLDGHPLAESALDNATGVAALLSLARAAAPLVGSLSRGLTVCVFGAEEWSLSGSRAWLAGLPRAEVEAMAMNLNLDSIAGSPNLTALTSGYPALGGFVQDAAAAAGHDLAVHLPVSVSSDHANFAHHGVPAMRLIAGFNEPASRLSRLLTAADTRDVMEPDELARATEIAASILWKALTAGPAEMAALRVGTPDINGPMATLSPLPTAQ
ncbi:M28 family metallopeptidase [Roseomonas sp. WA12]